MRWRGQRQSRNVEDRRGRGGIPMGRGAGIGCGGLVLILVIAFVTGQNPQQLVDAISQSQPQSSLPSGSGGSGSAPGNAPSDELGRFASTVLADTEDTWNQLFAAEGRDYREPTLVLFSDRVPSACGFASAAVGPFYCPADQKVYIDLSFFDQLARRFGAPGDFAQAYVLAHEVGHHIQNQLGIMREVQSAQQRTSQTQSNALSVRLELQADCLAGVWAHHAHKQRNLLEPGDIEEGMRAAAAIGDDRLQSQAQGYTRPESWTHGSSEQRVYWLKRGLQTGDTDTCDTFAS